MTTLFEVLHHKAEPYKVELTRGQKGGYGWTITVSAESIGKTIDMLDEADKRLREMFGGGDGNGN